MRDKNRGDIIKNTPYEQLWSSKYGPKQTKKFKWVIFQNFFEIDVILAALSIFCQV